MTEREQARTAARRLAIIRHAQEVSGISLLIGIGFAVVFGAPSLWPFT